MDVNFSYNVWKSRDITLLSKVPIAKAMIFPVVMHRCESWTIKKAEHWRTDAFELQCLRRFLRVTWTARSNQLILKEINFEYSLERIILKLQLQYSGHLTQRADSLEETPMLAKIEGKKEKGTTKDEMVRFHPWLNGHEFEPTPGDSEGQGSLACCSSWGCKKLDSTYWLNNSNIYANIHLKN